MTAIRRDLGALLASSGDDWFIWQPPAWYADALCAQVDYDIFYPEDGGTTRPARSTCASCDVREKCRDYALANDELWGIWGGTTESERRKLRAQRNRELKAAS